MPRVRPAAATFAAFGLLCASGTAAGPQGAGSAPVDPTRTLSVARDVMKAARYATFVTIGTKHQPQARIVDPLEPDETMTVYVATNPRSRKVREIRDDPRVTLLYFDAGRPAYVTLIGHARPVDTPEKRTHVKTEWAQFFPPDKPESYVLYRVEVTRVEVVSSKDGLPGDPTTWRPEIVNIR